ncbi:MAG: hypothetical protein F9K29_08810 [Hyphomicrobiaceae bacterium]|nr:MAG: hypothetical protein F9K29_08810 [Hyphomicrobiaceae bacterium]
MIAERGMIAPRATVRAKKLGTAEEAVIAGPRAAGRAASSSGRRNGAAVPVYPSDHKISVFTGPVFGDDLEYRADKPGGPWLIPARFWKVIVYKKSDGTQAATAFVLDQSDQIVDLEERVTPLPKVREVARVHQRAIKDVESLTGLSFGALRRFDPLKELEATKQVRRIMMPAQIVL